MNPEKQLIEHSGSSDGSSATCDECNLPAVKTVRDAGNNQHYFCKRHWDEHVAFVGNDGKPYGF